MEKQYKSTQTINGVDFPSDWIVKDLGEGQFEIKDPVYFNPDGTLKSNFSAEEVKNHACKVKVSEECIKSDELIDKIDSLNKCFDSIDEELNAHKHSIKQLQNEVIYGVRKKNTQLDQYKSLVGTILVMSSLVWFGII